MTKAGYAFYGGCSGNSTWQLLTAKGYTEANKRTAILALKDKPKRKTFCINPLLQDGGSMPFAIDRPEGNLLLTETTGGNDRGPWCRFPDEPAEPRQWRQARVSPCGELRIRQAFEAIDLRYRTNPLKGGQLKQFALTLQTRFGYDFFP